MQLGALLRIILLSLHLIAVGVWVASEVAMIALQQMQRTNAGKPAELTLMAANLRVTGFMGSLAGPIVLLTGLGLMVITGYGIFGIGAPTPLWLFIKQIIYVVLLVIVFVFIRPVASDLEADFAEARANNGLVSDQIKALARRVYSLGHIHTALVIINLVLAVWKPT